MSDFPPYPHTPPPPSQPLNDRPPEEAEDVATLRLGSVTMWLIALNVVVFFLERSNNFLIYRAGWFSIDAAVRHLQVWRFITFQFLHANKMHLLFNMMALYFFGPLIEYFLGSRRYLAFYLLCGIAGAALYIILGGIGILHETGQNQMVGASAGIFGVLIASAYVAPDATVMLLFPPIPVKLKWMAWGLIAIAVYTVFSSGHNAGGEAAHLGGAALGAILIRHPRWLNLFELGRPKRPGPQG